MRGVVWDREREEGMRIIQRKGMGREEKGRGRKEGGRDDLAPKQSSWIRHWIVNAQPQCQYIW
jgi:hypothetical protein